MKSFSYFDILAVALTLTNQLFNIGSFALKHIPVQLENCRTSVAPSTHAHTQNSQANYSNNCSEIYFRVNEQTYL